MSDNIEAKNASLPAPGRRWKRNIFFGVAIFLCGMLAGAGAMIHVHRLHPLRPSFSSIDKGRAFARLKRVLELDEEQARKMQAITTKGLGDLKDLRRVVRPQAEAIIERVRVGVEKELNEQQKDKWNKQFKLIRERWFPANIEQGIVGATTKGDKQ